MVSTVAPWAEPVPGVDRPVTADELLTWSEDPQFAWRYELVAGRLVRMPPTGVEHWDIGVPLFRALDTFTAAHNLGRVTWPDTGFRLNQPGQEDIVLSPDIAFVSAERLARLPARNTPERRRFFPMAPDLAVEIASPDQHWPEMATKAQLYVAMGVRLVWIAWPGRREVDMWRPGTARPAATLRPGDQLDGGDVVPGFTYPVADLFR